MSARRGLFTLALAIVVMAGAVACRPAVRVEVQTGSDTGAQQRQATPAPQPQGATPAPAPQPQGATPAPAPQPQGATPAPAPQPQGATPAPAPAPQPQEVTPAQGQSCTTSADCPQGLSCHGEQGCDAAWTCQYLRCTRDHVPFCGCDGQTFQASSTCPSRPYRSRGPCPTGAVTPPAQPAQGGQCTASSDCPQGQQCIGNEGCSAGATCRPSRPCTLDLVPFCGCDGQTFRGSSTCPPRAYSHRGPCQ